MADPNRSAMEQRVHLILANLSIDFQIQIRCDESTLRINLRPYYAEQPDTSLDVVLLLILFK